MARTELEVTGLISNWSGEVNIMAGSAANDRPIPRRFQATLVVVLSVSVVNSATAYQTRSLPRVRSHSATLGDAITRGVERSPTLRQLVESIDATDGLVYVDEGHCRNSVRACLVHNVRVSGPYRILQILVDPRKASGCALIAAIGHELQHALEALSDPTVRSDPDVFSLFHRIGQPDGYRYETKRAVQVGLLIEKEVCD